MNIDSGLASEQYCYLTTTGRVSGRPHTMEIWFGIDGSTLYMLPGGRDRSDWVKNLQRTLEVALRIADRQLRGQARVVHAVTDAEEDALARRLLMEKYAPGYERDLGDWEHPRGRSSPSPDHLGRLSPWLREARLPGALGGSDRVAGPPAGTRRIGRHRPP